MQNIMMFLFWLKYISFDQRKLFFLELFYAELILVMDMDIMNIYVYFFLEYLSKCLSIFLQTNLKAIICLINDLNGS